jgi:Uma2 family endonuclease
MSPKAALADPDFELVTGDGVPMDNPYHRMEMNLFLSLIRSRMLELGRADYFAGGDMFVYYSTEQAQAVAEEERQLALFESGRRPEKPKKTAFRGPDVFLVQDVDAEVERHAWIAWEEGDRLPDLIVELLSPSTAAYDRGGKKRLYEKTFKTSEYFLYPPQGTTLEGFRLLDNAYQPIARSAKGRLWSRELEVELGVWHGEYEGVTSTWLRLFHPDDRLVLTELEKSHQRAEEEHQRAEKSDQRAEEERQRAEEERQRAEKESQRAEAAEAEIARLRARLDESP